MNSIDILFDINNKHVLLIKRNNEPFKDYFALPGGRQENYETLTAAVVRTIKQRLGLALKSRIDEDQNIVLDFPGLAENIYLHQIRTYDSGTDPRGGNTTLFAVQINADPNRLHSLIRPGKQVTEFRIVPKGELPELAFDHALFIEQYYSKLRPYTETAESYNPDKYPKPSVTVDILIFTVQASRLKLLLIQRKTWPFKDYWAIPGGFIAVDEALDAAALRELREETGVSDVYLEQLYTFGEVERDPRTRVISVTYYALISSDDVTVEAASDAKDVSWVDVDELPELAFDHSTIVDYGLSRIRNKIEYTNIAFQLLPDKFTLSELQNVYEVILDRKLDKRNFRKKILESDVLIPLKESKTGGAHRPAKLFSFREKTDKTIVHTKKKI